MSLLYRLRDYTILLANNYLRKSDVSAERISVCDVVEKFTEHGIHCLPCSCDVIYLLPKQQIVHIGV